MRVHCLWLALLTVVVSSNALNLNLTSLKSATNEGANEKRVFVVVLGHGQVERSKGLSNTLYTFQRQLGAENFDCLVFVWNEKMPHPDVPPGCEIKVTPGVFMEYTRLIPEDRLQSAKYTYLMADDVTLDVPKYPMNIADLRDMADANCLDVITAAHNNPHWSYRQLGKAPWSDQFRPGRLLMFIEWQGQLVTPTVVHLLQRLSSSHITGCWGYDSLLYTGLKKWTGRLPRIGIDDLMTINIGGLGVSAKESYPKDKHPCGKVSDNPKNLDPGDQAKYWMRHAGLEDYHLHHSETLGNLVMPSRSHNTPQLCKALQAPGTLAKPDGDHR